LSDLIPQRSRRFSRRLAPEHQPTLWRFAILSLVSASVVSRLRKRKVIRFQWKS
jgi:hypothetical protein